MYVNVIVHEGAGGFAVGSPSCLELPNTADISTRMAWPDGKLLVNAVMGFSIARKVSAALLEPHN